MKISNRLLLIVSAGATALAFVGAGANASFTDSASASGSVTTGSVQVGLSTGGTGCGLARCTPWYADSNSTNNDDAGAKDWPYTATADAFTLSALNDIGDHFHAVVPLHLSNGGTLPLRAISLTITDPAHGGNNLEQDTVVTIKAADGTVLDAGSLSELISVGPIDLGTHLGPIEAGHDAWVTVDLTAPAHGYNQDGAHKADESQTMTPMFTVTGSDA